MSNSTSAELAVTCNTCGEPIESVPTWLIGAEVKFECERCRQKKSKAVSDLENEPRRAPKRTAATRVREEDEPIPDVDESEDDDVAEVEPYVEPELADIEDEPADIEADEAVAEP